MRKPAPRWVVWPQFGAAALNAGIVTAWITQGAWGHAVINGFATVVSVGVGFWLRGDLNR